MHVVPRCITSNLEMIESILADYVAMCKFGATLYEQHELTVHIFM